MDFIFSKKSTLDLVRERTYQGSFQTQSYELRSTFEELIDHSASYLTGAHPTYQSKIKEI